MYIYIYVYIYIYIYVIPGQTSCNVAPRSMRHHIQTNVMSRHTKTMSCQVIARAVSPHVIARQMSCQSRPMSSGTKTNVMWY